MGVNYTLRLEDFITTDNLTISIIPYWTRKMNRYCALEDGERSATSRESYLMPYLLQLY
jgi:hypothetical protein